MADKKAFLIIPTTSSNSDWNGDCDYAVVPVSEGVLKNDWLRRITQVENMKGTEPEILSLEVWDSTPYYVSYNTLEEFEEKEKITQITLDQEPVCVFVGGLAERFEEFILEKGTERTECDVVRVFEDSICWRCYPKHTEVRIETCLVYTDVLSRIMVILEGEQEGQYLLS